MTIEDDPIGKAEDVSRDLKAVATPEKAKASAWFFKTGPGQYGEGDQFIGVTMPEQRSIAKKYRDLEPGEIDKLLKSSIHEERSLALMILVYQFQHNNEKVQRTICDYYLDRRAYVNNWDLVDGSASQIVGAFLVDKDKAILKKLAQSHNLWDRRIAIIASANSIKNGDPQPTFEIADLLLNDQHDLIHKAVGWMLREVGKNCGPTALKEYLKPRYKTMPRTMLRYAIEHFDKDDRQKYLKGLV